MRLKINGISLNYELSGSGRCLTLIHGMGDDLSVWELVAPVWARHYQVLACEMRGFGQSDKPTEGYSAELLSRDLYHLLQKLGIPETFVLGFSMGGVIAQQFALDYPEVARALVIVGSASGCNEQYAKFYCDRGDAVLREGMEAADEIVQNAFSSGFKQAHPEVVARVIAQRRRNDPTAYAAACRAMARCDLTERIHQIQCPTLAIVGEQDTSVGVGGSVIMSRRIPNAEIKIVPDCGHLMSLEKPDVLAQAVLDFLAKV